jgi:DNA ligase-1
MNKLPTLYKYTATGATQEWTIFSEDGSFWTVSGQTDGKKVTSAKTSCTGKNVGRKNATTPNEQALREAQARWQKKRDEGYIDDVDALDGAGAGRVDPMLAKNYSDYKDELQFPVYCQPKLDGLRCIVTRHGAYSRKWKPFSTLQHIRDALQPIFDKYPTILAFDGEMYSHELKDNFEEIVSIVKQPKATAEDIAKCKELVQYHIYDYVPTEEYSTLVYKSRDLDLDVALIDAPSCLRRVKTTLVWSQEELDEQYNSCSVDGYEGQMIRTDAPYQQKRTKYLLKRKDFVDEEFLIVGYKEGKGNREGCITLRLCTKDGKEFDSVPVGGVEYLQDLWQKRLQLPGLYATVKYQNLSSDGIPRFNNTIKFRNLMGEDVVL